MPRTQTPEQRERAEVRYLKALGKGPLGPDRVLEQFEEVNGAVYRQVERKTSVGSTTPDGLMGVIEALAAEMIPDSVRVTVGDDGGYGDVMPVLIVQGRRLATAGEIAVYCDAKLTEDERRAKAQAERDMAELERLRKRYPDQFKETLKHE